MKVSLFTLVKYAVFKSCNIQTGSLQLSSTRNGKDLSQKNFRNFKKIYFAQPMQENVSGGVQNLNRAGIEYRPKILLEKGFP